MPPPPPDELAAVHDTRVKGFKRIALTLTLSAGAYAAVVMALPQLFIYVYFAALASYGLAGAWSLRPGRCVVCQNKTMMCLPRQIPYVTPNWWDLRIPSRNDRIFVCVEHLEDFMLMRASQRLVERWRDQEF